MVAVHCSGQSSSLATDPIAFDVAEVHANQRHRLTGVLLGNNSQGSFVHVAITFFADFPERLNASGEFIHSHSFSSQQFPPILPEPSGQFKGIHSTCGRPQLSQGIFEQADGRFDIP
jgi:hypothetical protein